jgi:hypothetical protein
MRFRLTASTLTAFAIGALSDFFLIRNGLSYGGQTLLDKDPALWPIWLAGIAVCTYLLENMRRAARNKERTLSAPGPALALLFGAMITHAVLFIHDVVADPTTHNLWPFEFLFWGIVVAAPALAGALLARFIPLRAVDD